MLNKLAKETLSIAFLLCLLISPIDSRSQNVGQRIRFASYLTNNEFFEESIYECEQILSYEELTDSQKDSVFYLKGWALYNLKKLGQSSKSLSEVNPKSPYYAKSHLFATYNLLHLKKYDQAQKKLISFQPQNNVQQDFTKFLSAGKDLIRRDIKQYQNKRNELPSDYYGFSSELKNLDNIAEELLQQNPKSPVLAGIMSGIIPGSGKIYAGKTGQGVSAFMMTTGLALVTLENYRKRGPESAGTIIFGSAFSLFYIGNIYGAAFSAKIANDEYNQVKDRQILFNLHVPLRNVFD